MQWSHFGRKKWFTEKYQGFFSTFLLTFPCFFLGVIPGSCNMKIAWVFLILLICAAAKEEDTKSCCESKQIHKQSSFDEFYSILPSCYKDKLKKWSSHLLNNLSNCLIGAPEKFQMSWTGFDPDAGALLSQTELWNHSDVSRSDHFFNSSPSNALHKHSNNNNNNNNNIDHNNNCHLLTYKAQVSI